MDLKAAETYAVACQSMGTILTGLLAWAKMLEGAQRDEAFHHIAQIATAYHGLTLAMADYEGIEL